MSDYSRNKSNKARGTRFESEVADYLQSLGVDAKRLPRTGVKDIGDISFPMKDGVHIVVEAKNRAKMDLPTFLEEANAEANNYSEKYPAVSATYPLVVVKRRGKGVHRSYAVFDLDELINMFKDLGLL